MTLLAAISLGFFGSFHCIGMCGPIALALPLADAKGLRRVMLIGLYNFGRMSTYALFGAIAGALGQGFAMAGLQQWLSLSIGVLMLVWLLIPELQGFRFLAGFTTIFVRLKSALGRRLKIRRDSSLFIVGLLNGLLPCGLVYAAIAVAIAIGNSAQGAIFMAVFGAGTLPVMVALPMLGNFISLKARNFIRSSMPVLVSFTAILLILRGLNLGVPYLSPQIKNNSANCHQQTSTENKTEIKCTGHDFQHNP